MTNRAIRQPLLWSQRWLGANAANVVNSVPLCNQTVGCRKKYIQKSEKKKLGKTKEIVSSVDKSLKKSWSETWMMMMTEYENKMSAGFRSNSERKEEGRRAGIWTRIFKFFEKINEIYDYNVKVNQNSTEIVSISSRYVLPLAKNIFAMMFEMYNSKQQDKRLQSTTKTMGDPERREAFKKWQFSRKSFSMDYILWDVTSSFYSLHCH